MTNCDGVACEDWCYGTTRVVVKCIDGVCYNDKFIKNSLLCGYVAPPASIPEPTPCPTPSLDFTVDSIDGMTVHLNVTKCDPGAGATWKPNSLNISGEDDNAIDNPSVGHYDYTFRTPGTHELYLIGENSCGNVANQHHTVTVSSDPCAGITCPNTCDGTSLYSQKCSNGKCIKDALIKTNAPECGYVAPAHGTMDNFTYPASVNRGEYFEVRCDVHNDGGSTGTFKIRYSINGVVVYTGARWSIPAGGVTRGAGGVFAPAPNTGTSMTVKLELIRET